MTTSEGPGAKAAMGSGGRGLFGSMCREDMAQTLALNEEIRADAAVAVVDLLAASVEVAAGKGNCLNLIG